MSPAAELGGLVLTADIHQLQYLNFGAAGLVFTTDIHQLQYQNFGAAGLVFTPDIHQLQYQNFGAAGLVFITDIHQLQYQNFGAAGLVFTTDIHQQLQDLNFGSLGLLRGIRHRNLAAIKMATQRGITQLQGPGDKEYQYQATNSLPLSFYRSIFLTSITLFHVFITLKVLSSTTQPNFDTAELFFLKCSQRITITGKTVFSLQVLI